MSIIMRDLWQGRSQAVKPLRGTRSAGPSFYCFYIGLIIPIGIILRVSSTNEISFREGDFGNPIIDVHGYDVRYYLSVAMMKFTSDLSM